MTKLTPKQMKYIEDGFFDDEKNTSISFTRLSKKYDVSGLDEIIRDICPVIPKEYNDGDAVYSFKGGLAKEYKNDYDTVKERHEKDKKTWYNITDGGITRKNFGMDSGFVDIE